jgi:PAS domain S-box-containing protein
MPGMKRKPNSLTPSAKKVGAKRSAKKVSSKHATITPKNMNALLASQRQLDIVLHAAHMGIWEWDVKTNEVIWSGSVLEIYGLSPKDFGGTFERYQQLLFPDDRGKMEKAIEEAFRNIKPYHVQHRIFHSDGSIRWIEAFGNVLRDKKGNPVKMTGTVQDITAKKTAEQHLEDSNIRHELITSSAGIVIYDYDIPTGNIIWSGNSLEVLGYHPEELGNIDRWAELIHPNDRDEAFRQLELAQQKNCPYDVCYRFSTKSGNYCYLHDRGMFLADQNGKATRMVGMMNDVTERIRAQESLKESEQRFRVLQQASFGGIGLHDQGVIMDCNQGLCNLTGYSYNELIGSNGLQLIAPEWRDFVTEKIRSGYDKTYDAEGIRKDGTRYILEIRGKNLPYEGRVIRVTEFRDITERKRSEEKIVEQNTRLLAVTDELKRKNNQLEEFTQIVSHNLRSPVGNIVSLLNFFDDATSEEERKEFIVLLKEAGSTTLSMLNELNEILKIKQNKNIEIQPLRFEHVLNQIKSMLNAKITELSATVTYDFDRAPVIQYPVVYLESILLNLLDNALKYYSPERQPVISFKSYLNENGNVMLEVADNGLGINLKRYGHQVFKLRKTFHHHAESRGIGLFMIRNQIETMGGEITISSSENVGSTFLINFNKHHTDGS